MRKVLLSIAIIFVLGSSSMAVSQDTQENCRANPVFIPLSSHRKQVQELEERVAILESNLTALEALVASNTLGIQANANAITGNDAAIVTGAGDIAANTAAIANNTSGISTNATAITANTGSISTNQGNIAANTTAIVGNGTGIANNATQITTINTTVTGHGTAIATLENSNVMDLDPYITVDTAGDPRGPLVQLAGVNLQVVNGMGSTATTNGLGNVIVGYDEGRGTTGVVTTGFCSINYYSIPDQDSSQAECEGAGGTWYSITYTENKTGSHNLVVGRLNHYGSYGGLVAGYYNSIGGPYAAVTGGRYNKAISNYSSVSGGRGNMAGNNSSTVSGGSYNMAAGPYSSVSGGSRSRAGKDYSSVGGGSFVTAHGVYSSVSGGLRNFAHGLYSTIAGGSSNTVDGSYGTVCGGSANSATGSSSTILGGSSNSATGSRSTITGGSNLTEATDYGYANPYHP